MNSKLASADPIATEVRPHRDLIQFYATRESRARFLSELFDKTAPAYDRVSAVLSFGTCKTYRKQALQRGGLAPGMRMLDVATGTGLMAQAAQALGMRRSEICGLDPSWGMLTENRKNCGIPVFQGRGESLPFSDGSFDFVGMAYALRHVEDLLRLFGEFRRVLKPGGRLLVLEITRPESRLGYALARIYFGNFVPAVMRWMTGSRDVRRLLQYYWATIRECVPPETVLAALRSTGFSPVERRRLPSIFSEYVAVKPPTCGE